jgi:hypothetical protein
VRLSILVLVVLALITCAAGCGKKAPSAADAAPFGAAITDYLAGKSMGMEAQEFESLELSGNSAEAVCKMAVADDLYGGVTVRWRFTFTRADGGAWKVTRHEKL